MFKAKKLNVDVNEFCRFFRKKIRDPFVDKTIQRFSNAQDKVNAENGINETIPRRIFEEMDKLENNTGIRGISKKGYLEQLFHVLLKDYKLEVLFPILVSKLQLVVLFSYKKYYMAKFKKAGVHELLEELLSLDVDEDGDIGESANNEDADSQQKLSF